MKLGRKTRTRERKKIRERMRGIYLAPNIVTTASLFCGFYSMVLSASGKYHLAAWLIVAAGVFDMFDGLIARITRSTSPFGREYDSLSDLISFGVAPSLLMYFWSLHLLGRLGWTASFLFVAFAALRLARFNVLTMTGQQKTDYVGLASTVAGVTTASLILFCYHLQIDDLRLNPYPFLIFVYFWGLLMVSPFNYRSHRELFVGQRKPFEYLVLAVVILYLLVYNPEITLLTGGLVYSLSAPTEWVWKKVLFRHRYQQVATQEGFGTPQGG